MAWRLRLVPVKTNIDFFKLQFVTFGASVVAVGCSGDAASSFAEPRDAGFWRL